METKRKIITEARNMDNDKILSKRKSFDSLKEEFQKNRKSSILKNKKLYWVSGIAAGISLLFVISLFYDNKNTDNHLVANNLIIADTSYFSKPFPELIAYQKFKIDSKKDVVLKSKKGSRIHIKANTFVDKNGKTVDGEVEVIYNEYHNPVELFLSGIPMKYDSAGFGYTFESAGMFEIYAKKDNEFLAMNENNPINIDLVSEQKEAFNLYYYDTKENKWSFLNNEKQADLIKKENNTETENDQVIEPQKIEKKNDITTSDIEEVVIRKANPDNYSFSIDINENDFPELSKYKNLLFEIDKSDTNFKEEYYDVNWTKVSLSKSDDEGYTVELSRFKKTIEFKAYPVLNAADYEKNIAEFNKKQAEKAKLREKNMEVASVKALRNKEMIAEKEMMNNFENYRNLSIYNLGTYNYDRPLPTPEFPMQISFNFRDNAGNIIKYNELNIAQKGKRILWKYNRNNQPYISKKLDNIIWFITPTNEMAITEINSKNRESFFADQKIEIYKIKDGIEKLKILLNVV